MKDPPPAPPATTKIVAWVVSVAAVNVPEELNVVITAS
jgi:hypothetical protein